MVLRLLLYLQIVYTVYQIHFPLDTHIPAVNVSNLLFFATLLALPFTARGEVDGPPAQPGLLRWPLLGYFFALTLALVIAQMRMPRDLVGDITYYKNALFYPLLYFMYLHCRQDRAGTRQLIILVMVVAFVAGLQAMRQGLDYGFSSFAENHRAAGPFGRDYRDANRAGVYYAMFLPLFIAVALFFRGRWLWRGAALAGAAVIGFAILVTYSRQSYFIALLGLGLLLLRRNLVLAVVLGFALSSMTAYLPDTVTQRVQETQQRDAAGGEQVDESTSSRWEIWDGAFAMWRDQPFGIGLNRFPLVIGDYSRYENKDAHNYYVLTLAETGLQGLAALLLVIAALFRLAGRLRRAAPPDDAQARALAIGFTVCTVCMACGNFYGSPFLNGAVMGDYWILCGLLERYLRQLATAATPAAATQPGVPAQALAQRFPQAARILPGRRA